MRFLSLVLIAALLPQSAGADFPPGELRTIRDENGKITFRVGDVGALPNIGHYRPIQILGEEELMVEGSGNGHSLFFILKGFPTKGLNQNGPWTEFEKQLYKMTVKVRGIEKYKNGQGFDKTAVLLSPLDGKELAEFRKEKENRLAASEAANKASERRRETYRKEFEDEKAKRAAKRQAKREAAREQYEADAPKRAAAKLRLIKTLLGDEKKTQLVILRLKQLAKEYAETPAAAEAKKLADKMENEIDEAVEKVKK